MPRLSFPPSPPSILEVSFAFCQAQAYRDYQSSHSPVQRMPMVSPKLGIGALKGGVAVGFWLLDSGGCVNVSLVSFQEDCRIDISRPSRVSGKKGNRTRSCGLSCSDCAGRSS